MQIVVKNKEQITADELKSCAKILSESFSHEPGLNWVCSPQKMEAWFYQTAKLILSSKKSELIYTQSESKLLIACALVSPPQFKPNFAAQINWIWGVLKYCGWRSVLRTLQYVINVESQKGQNEYCLEFIGVSNNNRGQGLSRKIINLIANRIQPNQIFLTTADPQNIKLYEHLGFQLINENNTLAVPIYSMKK